MRDLLNYLAHNLWWPVPAVIACFGLGLAIGAIGRRT